MIWLGVLGNTLYQLAFTLALLWSTATNTALLLATMPARASRSWPACGGSNG